MMNITDSVYYCNTRHLSEFMVGVNVTMKFEFYPPRNDTSDDQYDYVYENFTIKFMKDLWDKQVKLHYERIHDRYAKINHLAYLRNFPQIYSVNDILRNIINNTLAETAFINQTRIENLLDEPKPINIDVSSPEFMIFWWGCVGGLFFCLTFINTFCDDYGAKEDEKKRKLDKKKKLQ